MEGVLRRRVSGETPPVSNVELFFDLVYVFAVTQLSHNLLEHLNGRGALESLVLFLAVWWAWNYTAWATNWIEPAQPSVRLLLVGLMLVSLVMSAAIPEAFSSRGFPFAAAYVGLQVVRSGFMVAALWGTRMGRNYAQLLAWSSIAGAVWIGGAFASADARLWIWIAAVAIDYGAPLYGFALPGLGRTPTGEWTLAGGHLAERNQLVLLIALGESILAIGATFAGLSWSAAVLAAFAVGFLSTASFWWIYFGRAEEAASTIARAADPTRVARLGYAYAHGLMVAGVIVLAVAIDLTIGHPARTVWGSATAVILGAPALYLAGNLLYKLALLGTILWSRVAAIAALTLLIPVATAVDRLALAPRWRLWCWFSRLLQAAQIGNRRDMATVLRHELVGSEGFRLEARQGLLGWVEETWLGASNEPVALAIRTIDGRDGLLLAEDVDLVDPDSELLGMRTGARLLELDVPRVDTASSNGLAASWRTTGAPLEPLPEPPGAVDRVLLAIRPWRLAPPPRTGAERPLWLQIAVLYTSLALIVVLVIGLCFLIARIATGSAI